MELKISEIKLPEQISFNYEELKTELAERISKYETLVYNETEIKTAKADRSNLNKLKKALNDERIRQEKEYMKPFNTFKAQINEIIAMIDKPILMIDGQVKNFEERKREDKLEEIKEFWTNTEFQLPIPLTFEQIFNEKWLNASVKMSTIETEIKEKIQQIQTDLKTLENLPEFSFEAIEVYKDTLDINKAIQEGQKLADLQKRKAEAIQTANAINETSEKATENVVEKEWVSFKALLSTEDAKALSQFFRSKNIKYEPIYS